MVLSLCCISDTTAQHMVSSAKATIFGESEEREVHVCTQL